MPHRNYLSNEPILMQLILREYIETCRVIKPTLRFLKKELKREWSFNDFQPVLDKITTSIFAIGGPCKRPLFTTPWNQKQGHLEILEDYSYLLALNTERNNPTYFVLHQDIQSARVSVKQCLRLLQLWDCQSSMFMETIDPSQIQVCLSELYDHIKKIGNSLSTVLQFGGMNENVALFFLRHHQEIMNAVGKRFFRETLKKIFPSGATKAQIELKKRLKKRGFEHLIEPIPDLFKKVKL